MAKKLKYVVVRTYSAGVHVGELASRKGKEVTLKNARRLWAWRGAFTLNEISVAGVAAGSKVSAPASEVVLTEAIEVLACSKRAEDILRAATWTQ